MILIPYIVYQKSRPATVVGHQYVHITIVIHIAKGRSTTHLCKGKDLSRLFTNLTETTVTQIGEELICNPTGERMRG